MIIVADCPLIIKGALIKAGEEVELSSEKIEQLKEAGINYEYISDLEETIEIPEPVIEEPIKKSRKKRKA